MQANSKITELEAKLAELQQELAVLQMQDKRTPIARDDPYSFSGSDSELSGDDLFSAPKTSQSLSNSDLGYLQHSLDSDHLQVPEKLWSTSYSKPLPAVPNATSCSFHSDPLPDIPSDGCSKTSTSSEGNPETSWILHLPIRSPVQCSSETLQAIVEIERLPWHLILRIKLLK